MMRREYPRLNFHAPLIMPLATRQPAPDMQSGAQT